MMRNLEIATQLLQKGSVLHIPRVEFSSGITKNKYCVLAEDGTAFWKKGYITGCLTTSKTPTPLKPWQVAVGKGFQILGDHQKKTTYIDCRNKINLRENQIKKCTHLSDLPDEIKILFDNALQIADAYEQAS